MYHSKKAGIFISYIMGYYQKHVCQGMIDQAKDYGYAADIFASLDGEDPGTCSTGEDRHFVTLLHASDDAVSYKAKKRDRYGVPVSLSVFV